VEQIRQALVPKAPALSVVELQPEWSSYDALLNGQPKVAYAG
jgi:hypothetical protein